MCLLPSTLLLQSHDCLRSGPPDVEELIVVSMPNGQVLNASFIRQHTHNLYQVRNNATFKNRCAEISLHILCANVYEAINSFCIFFF